MATTDFIKRSEIFTFIKTGTVSGVDVFAEMAAGVMQLNDALNPTVQTEAYIMDESATSTVDGYEASWAFTQRVSKTDPAAQYLFGLAEDRATGTDAQTDLVRFNAWEIEIDGTVPAKLHHVAVAIDYNANGDPRSNIEMSGTLYAQGDPVDGTFDTNTNAFTATVVS